ncbi:MAG: ferritin [Deltaproteobacteria bacterium]|nr:ferritin [Deltaproteobacteria bacterium]
MAGNKMYEALNEQIKYELYSSYLYLSMSAYFSEAGLNGFANWMMVQAKEEMTHANKLYGYLISRGAPIKLLPIDGPPSAWKSPLDVLQEGLKHERFVTSRFNMLMDLADKSKDHASKIFLQWYVTEQVEEEENFTDLVNKLKFIKDDGGALFMLDKDLAARAFVDSTQAAEA